MRPGQGAVTTCCGWEKLSKRLDSTAGAAYLLASVMPCMSSTTGLGPRCVLRYLSSGGGRWANRTTPAQRMQGEHHSAQAQA